MKPTRTGVRWILSISAALLATSATADIPSAANECVSDLVETTPSGDFTPLEEGAVVRHETTGLEWRRCVDGMSWTGTECTGSANTWTWGSANAWTLQGALQHADAVLGWRLPNINELRSIVERCRTGPAVNQQVFPGTPFSPVEAGFWSASPAAGLSDHAWSIHFFNGAEFWFHRNVNFRVRLVRGGE